MVKVVMDTNIIVSATIAKHGNEAKALDAWRDKKVELIISPQILEEMGRVLLYRRIRKQSWMTEKEIREFLFELANAATITPGLLKLKKVVKHAPDHKFLVAAVEGKADYIVSGDQHLRELGSYEGVKIAPAGEFLRILNRLHFN